ncbi:uncharacterized protein LOC105439105 [Strongylocentrotus purpuratus]|uniref:Uncharacterized protein n=1 Tax=Strongylocentrotus purpuratus TaxID=7668 RepID=A0A7M7HHJ2_STRPU|nr:uncharacterized protein LOC105439105 [Strongylocentrotus purpuratus]|eukprot:XP_011665990.1 PREDICTED: uncharacterized protein LOC105439105 [Strongylocentrotus purpuratus]
MMTAVDNHVLDIVGEFSPVIVGIGGGADSLAAMPVTPKHVTPMPVTPKPVTPVTPVTPVMPSTPVASSSNRQSSNSSPSVGFQVSRPKFSESAGKRAGQTDTTYNDYLHVEMKRAKLDMERIQAEKEKIYLEKQKLQLEILKLRFELEEKTQVKEVDVIDFTNIEI